MAAPQTSPITDSVSTKINNITRFVRQATDQARLSAQAGPVLDRLDWWMTSWQNSVVQQFERVLQQNSHDHNSHSKGAQGAGETDSSRL